MTRGARYAPSTSGRGTSHSSAGAYFNNQFWGGGRGNMCAYCLWYRGLHPHHTTAACPV